jgi:LemA protein
MSTGAAAVFGIVTGFVVLIAILCIAVYNKLDLLRNTLQSHWSDIEGKLRKQYDLVADLVTTVRASAPHEDPVFDKVSQSRSMALQASSPSAKAKAEQVLTDALNRLFVVADACPELQTRADFIELRNKLRGIGDGIERARTHYNNIVRDYNVIVESFPSSMLAMSFKFGRAEFFEPESLASDNGGQR